MGFRSQDVSADTAQICRTMDETPEWLAIFDRLARMIGPKSAAAWFGHVRFLRMTDTDLELAHWSSFCADECLKRHGYDLERASGRKRVKIHRSGGFIPAAVHNVVAERQGFVIWERGKQKAPKAA